jgi:hypothetical protein
MTMAAATANTPPPMLFAFRGMRFFQLILVIAALAMGVGATLSLKAFVDNDVIPMLFVALILGAVFIWAFSTALRAPTSFVAITDERMRIRFAGFVDTVIATADVTGARLVRRNILGGIGVRTNFGGDVALVSAWGEVVELTLRKPMRVWLIPKLIPLRAERLTLSLRNPQKVVERFGTAPAANATARKPRQRGSRTR